MITLLWELCQDELLEVILLAFTVKKNSLSRGIRKKLCHIGHRRYLAMVDRLRKSLAFDGHHEKRQKPVKFNKEELLDQLEEVKDVRPGKHPGNKKRKRQGKDETQLFSRRSRLFELA